jgi:nucleoside-diphosphate-sugar epimerase
MVQRLPSERILITGASGFVGSNLTRRIVRMGFRPHIIIRQNTECWRIADILGKVSVHRLYLEDKPSLLRLVRRVKPQVVFHLAAYGGYHFQSDLNRIFSVNIASMINLLESCAGKDLKAFVNTGSSSEYGIKDKPMQEDILLDPVNAYGAAKASATLLCRQFAINMGLPVVTLRLFSPYGYYEDFRRLVAGAILNCLDNKPLKFSSPGSVRDFIFIEDVLDAYLKAACRIDKVKGEIINIGSGRQYSVLEVVKAIKAITGSRIKPSWGALKNPRIEPRIWQADISKAKKLLGWQPRFTLREGLEKTVSWFKQNRFLYAG